MKNAMISQDFTVKDRGMKPAKAKFIVKNNFVMR
jgi:hypothetical protein